MQFMTSDGMVVVPRELLRKAEVDNPELEDMKLFMDMGKVSSDDYWAALKPALDKIIQT